MRPRDRIVDPRGRRLLDVLPGWAAWRTCLYIGANTDRFQLYGMIEHMDVTVLEVWPDYARELRADPKHKVARVIVGDVRELDATGVSDFAPFDVVIWWHGPEHVGRVEAEDILWPGRRGVLEPYWEHALVVGCPWGRHDQGAVDGNPHQEHKWAPEPWFFKRLGFQTQTYGRKDHKGRITAWRTR